MFVEVGRQGDACGLEDVSDMACDVGSGGDDLAVLLDGGLLEGKTVCPFRERGWFALHWCSEGCSGGPSLSSHEEDEPWNI